MYKTSFSQLHTFLPSFLSFFSPLLLPQYLSCLFVLFQASLYTCSVTLRCFSRIDTRFCLYITQASGFQGLPCPSVWAGQVASREPACSLPSACPSLSLGMAWHGRRLLLHFSLFLLSSPLFPPASPPPLLSPRHWGWLFPPRLREGLPVAFCLPSFSFLSCFAVCVGVCMCDGEGFSA